MVRSLSDPMLNKTSNLKRSNVYLERLQYAKKVEGRISRNANSTGLDQSQSNSRINSATGTNRKVSGNDSATANYNSKYVMGNIIANTQDMNVTEF